MKALASLFASSLFALAVGCGGGQDVDQSGSRPAPLRGSVDLSQYQACDLETPCPDGLQCVVLGLPEGDSQPVCIEPGEACELVDCGGDECALLESYPAQVRCTGTCEGDDCDDPVSD